MTSNRPTKLAHVVYRTRRFEQMVDWYQKVFGAKVQYGNAALAFLTFDDEHHRFAIVNLDVLRPDGSRKDHTGMVGVDHLGWSYASLEDLFGNYERLKSEGIRPYWTIHHGITVSMYYADPDGNQMEFQVDCIGSAEASEFMHTAFEANPIGVEFDADEWLEKLKNGVAAADLLVRKETLPVSPIRGAFATMAD
jgi:catechol-2,3-dioxygenase